MRRAAWLLVAACAHAPLAPPRVLVTRVDVDAVTLQIYGPPRACRAIDWTISVDERPIARGRADVDARAPGEITFTPSLLPGAAAKLASAQGTRRVDGVLHCDDAAAMFHQ